jgi:lysophospholipase L1-like esterase
MNSADHVLEAKILLQELPRVDVVVVLVGVNDVNVALAMPETYEPMPAEIDPAKHEKEIRRVFVQVPGTLEHSWDYESSFLKRTQIFQLVRKLRRQRSQDLASHHLVNDDTGKSMLMWRDHRRQAKRIVNELPDLTKALATYRANLGTLADVVAKRGAKLVLLTQPTLWRADLTEEEQKLLWMGGTGDYMKEPGHEYYSITALAEAMKRFNETLLSVCKDKGIGCVDLTKDLPPSTQIFYDDCHFGHTGSEKIAQAVAAFLKKEPPFSGK